MSQRVRHRLLSIVFACSSLSSAALAQSDAQPPHVDPILAGGLQTALSPACSSHSSDESIVVCGKHTDRFRIPEKLRNPARPSASIRPTMPLAAGDLAPCGLFQGQRRCGRNEAAQYGYGAGRDPITVALKVIDALRRGKK